MKTRKTRHRKRPGLGGLRAFAVALLALAAAGCTQFQNLQVARHNTAAITGARADQIFVDATRLLKRSDGPDDVACCTEFDRNGAVTVFTAGNGVINSAADFQQALNQPGFVKVVNQINWCGAILPNVIGCAPVPGNSMVVVRFTAAREGILWAHEYGHTKGLSHRNDPNAVMNPVIGPTRLRVNSAECTAYNQGGRARLFEFCSGQRN